MSREERKARFHEAYLNAAMEASDAEWRAKKAKADNRKSDYDFWMIQFEWASERADHFFDEYMCA